MLKHFVESNPLISKELFPIFMYLSIFQTLSQQISDIELVKPPLPLPNIPVHTISFSDAKIIKDAMNELETDFPSEWKGKLKWKNFGGTFSNSLKLKITTSNELKETKITNIVGTIHGKIEPDRYIIIGSRRNSWG